MLPVPSPLWPSITKLLLPLRQGGRVDSGLGPVLRGRCFDLAGKETQS